MSEYEIKKVDKLPPSRARKVTVYDRLLEDTLKKGTGVYEIKIPNRKSSSVYSAISKRIKDRNDIKIHSRSGVIYLEVFK
jgi:hypothetical protein